MFCIETGTMKIRSLGSYRGLHVSLSRSRFREYVEILKIGGNEESERENEIV